MSDSNPCASSATPNTPAYDLMKEIELILDSRRGVHASKRRHLHRLAKQSLSEWADLKTSLNILQDVFDAEAELHQELLNGAKKVAAILGEIESWTPDVAAAVMQARVLIEDHIILSDPDYIRWTIAAPITDA